MDFTCLYKIGDCISFPFSFNNGCVLKIHGWIKDITFDSLFPNTPNILIKSCPSNICFMIHSFDDIEFYQPDSIDCSICKQSLH